MHLLCICMLTEDMNESWLWMVLLKWLKVRGRVRRKCREYLEIYGLSVEVGFWKKWTLKQLDECKTKDGCVFSTFMSIWMWIDMKVVEADMRDLKWVILFDLGNNRDESINNPRLGRRTTNSCASSLGSAYTRAMFTSDCCDSCRKCHSPRCIKYGNIAARKSAPFSPARDVEGKRVAPLQKFEAKKYA